MTRQVSPFAALTGAEKQLKWLEYQSVRLPYVQGSVDAVLEDATEAARPQAAKRQSPQPTERSEPPKRSETPKPTQELRGQHASPPEKNEIKNRVPPEPQAPGEAVRIRQPASGSPALLVQAPSPADFQKTRHRQYDAVIAKMKQAELRTRQYEPLR